LNKYILNTGVQGFIKNNLNTDISSVLLKKVIFNGVSTLELVEQLEAKKKCKEKLPLWFNTPNIYYPNKLNIEQTSSETTAQYKANLINGKSLIDLTGGLGIDAYYFALKTAQVYHCEINENLSQIAAHNFKILEANNIQLSTKNGIDFLEESNQFFDWIYVDPSRRNDAKGKVFLLSDCLPNVTQHLTLFFKKTNQVLIKTSPLLDISNGIKELQHVKEIHVVAVKNEVKELLWILENGFEGDVSIKAVNLTPQKEETFVYKLSEQHTTKVSYSKPKKYLYEPNAAILKSGGFNTVSAYFSLFKLHKHSHLYTSDALIDFPGRVFIVNEVLPYKKKFLKQLPQKANITTRNFPESVAAIRKKCRIKDGGDVYLFFTTDLENEKIVVVCEKVSQ
jgi:16S rRNA G966 N2-methylase RsmD